MKLTEQRTAIARAIWNIRREDEDRCDIELEDLGHDHSVWREADAAIAALPKPEPYAVVDANDECCWADILPDRNVKVGQLLYTEAPIAPPASEQKPVAYLVSIEGEPELGHWFAETNTAVPGVLYKPLYLAPQPDYKAQRDALLKSLKETLECGEDGDWQSARRVLAAALDQPHDDSTLRRLLAEAKAGVYEECAKVCEISDRYRGDYFAAKIRELAEKAKA